MSDSRDLALSVALLEELADRWRRQSVPIVDQLRPGLTAEQMDEAVAPLGITLTSEARAWWGWHDGVSVTGSSRSGYSMGSGWWYCTLSAAVDLTLKERDAAKSMREYVDPEAYWRSGWLALSRNAHGGLVAIDCSLPLAVETPVYGIDGADRDLGAETGTRSMGELVQWWIEAIDDGATTFDPRAERWSYDYARLPPEREMTRLV